MKAISIIIVIVSYIIQLGAITCECEFEDSRHAFKFKLKGWYK